MATQRARPTAHLRKLDLSDLTGVIVLGEPLEVLASAVLRIRVRESQAGGHTVRFAFPTREGDAFMRAMGRVSQEVPGDERPIEEREMDRFVLVVERVSEAWRAVAHGHDRGRARAMFQRPALPG